VPGAAEGGYAALFAAAPLVTVTRSSTLGEVRGVAPRRRPPRR
jgi:hypothetical protein